MSERIAVNVGKEIDVGSKYGEIIDKSREQVASFFGYGNIPFSFYIDLLETRQEMDAAWGEKTEEWVCGMTDKGKGGVSLFRKELFDSLTIHPREYFDKVLTHEICHLFTGNLYYLYQPAWLNEGISCVVAGQHTRNSNAKADLRSFETFAQWNMDPQYSSATSFTKKLVDDYGRPALVGLLERIRDSEMDDSFRDLFFVNYEESFDYVLSRWLEY